MYLLFVVVAQYLLFIAVASLIVFGGIELYLRMKETTHE